MSQKWSVKALVSYLKLKLDNDFLIQNINVVGEISNFNYHNNRHMYFTLKDESSRISCVMFANNASRVKFKVENGMKVSLKANVSLFEASGSLQLYVSEMVEDGVGDLAKRFELLKKTLHKEGLFDESLKKEFLKYPNSIAVVSGRDSAALNDILTTLNRRWPVATVSVYNSLVQGPTAHLDIIENLKEIDNLNYDAIILARGGGSIEDLWAFNEEQLARVIHSLKTPIVSGVGHEIDFTISDFVSDLRAPTPTAAAELITPDINEVIKLFETYKHTLVERINNKLNNSIQLIDTYSNSSAYKHPELMFSKYEAIILKHKEGLYSFKDKKLSQINQFSMISNEFTSKINEVIYSERLKINNIDNSIKNNIKNYENKLKANFKNQLTLLDSYSPINTLKRGYSLVEIDDNVISKVSEIDINSEINIKMSDGNIMAKVIKKELNNE